MTASHLASLHLPFIDRNAMAWPRPIVPIFVLVWMEDDRTILCFSLFSRRWHMYVQYVRIRK